ncbi:ribosomal RNA-processing protein [Tasmannia lanceolata]|uniref:ribosomal RNA-processing protein n=1 Tax=Tasmannia lanceolata TaxID=3420 RepID=UPI004064BED0
MEAEESASQNQHVRGRHIKKRALRNKALSIEFNDKDLRDYTTGFHKRKKKRRKEAQRQIEEKDRLKRIEQRKKRKLEKELALYGGVVPVDNQQVASSGPGECGNNLEDDAPEPTVSVSGTKLYDGGDTTITVTTSELSREDEDLAILRLTPKVSIEAEKKPSLPVQKKSFKKVAKQRSQKRSGKKPKKSAPPKRGKKITNKR